MFHLNSGIIVILNCIKNLGIDSHMCASLYAHVHVNATTNIINTVQFAKDLTSLSIFLFAGNKA